MGWGIPPWLPLATGIDSALKVSRLTPASRLPGRLPRSLGELQIANRGGPSWTSEVQVLLAQKVTPLALRAGPSYGILALFRSARGRLSLSHLSSVPSDSHAVAEGPLLPALS